MSKGHMVATVAIMAALQQPILASESLWTAVTLARDGSMGVGVHHSRGKAVALAAVDCRRVARRINDCGSMFVAIQQGWVVAVLCQDQSILVTGRTLAEAQTEAVRRQGMVRAQYNPATAACRSIATIDIGEMSP